MRLSLDFQIIDNVRKIRNQKIRKSEKTSLHLYLFVFAFTDSRCRCGSNKDGKPKKEHLELLVKSKHKMLDFYHFGWTRQVTSDLRFIIDCIIADYFIHIVKAYNCRRSREGETNQGIIFIPNFSWLDNALNSLTEHQQTEHKMTCPWQQNWLIS